MKSCHTSATMAILGMGYGMRVPGDGILGPSGVGYHFEGMGDGYLQIVRDDPYNKHQIRR